MVEETLSVLAQLERTARRAAEAAEKLAAGACAALDDPADDHMLLDSDIQQAAAWVSVAAGAVATRNDLAAAAAGPDGPSA